MCDRPRRPDVVEAVEMIADDDRRLPFVAHQALGAERLPPRLRGISITIAAEVDEHRAMVFPCRDEHSPVDNDRRRRVAAEVGLERESPQFLSRPRTEPDDLGAGDADDLLRLTDLEHRRR